MNRIDHLDLDGKSLTTFITVLDEMSASRAGERLVGYSVCGKPPYYFFFAWAPLNDGFG